jgi:hypothetical protein
MTPIRNYGIIILPNSYDIIDDGGEEAQYPFQATLFDPHVYNIAILKEVDETKKE